MSDWYEVSLSKAGTSNWLPPTSILAVSPVRAAEECLKDEAEHCDSWFDCAWDARVELGEKVSYVRLERPKRIITTSGTEYQPD